MNNSFDFPLIGRTGLKNVQITDDLGIPSVMVRIPRFNIGDIISGGPDVPHPMFIINGDIKDEIYIGKFLSTLYRDRGYSIGNRIPVSNITVNQAAKYASNKGPGWHVMTNAEYSGLALFAKANGFFPRGNDYNGKSSKNPNERGRVAVYFSDTYTPTESKPKYFTGQVIKINTVGAPNKFNTGNAKRIKIDCYGANGGGYLYGSMFNRGGNGAHTYGEMNLTKATDLYVYCGGIGGYSDISTGYGYNGGGKIITGDTNASFGGGATDIRTKYNINPLDLESLQSRFIVAGGGGAADTDFSSAEISGGNGGNAGGWIGEDGTSTKNLYEGGGGTQTSGGIGDITGYTVTAGSKDGGFGYGSTCTLNLSSAAPSYVVGVGGGGWYGGGVGCVGGGGAGSSYVAGNPNCPTPHPDGITLINSGTEMNPYKTAGYCVITILEVFEGTERTFNQGEKIKFSCVEAPQTFNTKNITKMKIECYGAFGGGINNAGGKGGYASGELTINEPKDLHVFVGGKGMTSVQTNPNILNTIGGYNGGGNGGIDYFDHGNGQKLHGSSGGGATDIRTKINDTCKVPWNLINDRITYPFILKESDTSYKMWGTTISSGIRIVYAESTDGKNWSIPSIVMDIGNTKYNTIYSAYSHVIKDGSIYKMWFSGYDGTNYRILYSESNDGKVWSTPILVMDKGGTSYNTTFSWLPHVIKDDTTYKMWFSGYNGTNHRLLYSESTDGKVWSTPILVMDKGATSYSTISVYGAFIIKESDTSYKMWTGANDGTNDRVLYSTSVDGKVWSTPILVMDKGTCDFNQIGSFTPEIIKESDTSYKMWFTGRSENTTTLTFKTLYSESTDGIVWSTPISVIKYPELTETLQSRLIVAAGGGGAGWSSTGSNLVGGNAGGYVGLKGSNSANGMIGGEPGTQSTGYALGFGGDGVLSNIFCAGSGAGGGYYGGLGGAASGAASQYGASGGGGSAYIAGDVNCPTPHPDGIVLTNTYTAVRSDTPITSDGYCVITVLETTDTQKYGVGDKVRIDMKKYNEDYYAADSSGTNIYKIKNGVVDAGSAITIGSTPYSQTLDLDGNLWVTYATGVAKIVNGVKVLSVETNAGAYMVYCDLNNNIYVTHYNSGNAVMVSKITNGVKVSDINIGASSVPIALAFNSKNEMYVLNTTANKVCKFVNDVWVKDITVPIRPYDIAIDKDDNIYVSPWGYAYITKITNDVVATNIALPASGSGNLTIDIYNNLWYSMSGALYKISNDKIMYKLTLTNNSQYVSTDKDGNVYVGGTGSNITIVNNDKIMKTVTSIGTGVGVSGDPFGIKLLRLQGKLGTLRPSIKFTTDNIKRVKIESYADGNSIAGNLISGELSIESNTSLYMGLDVDKVKITESVDNDTNLILKNNDTSLLYMNYSTGELMTLKNNIKSGLFLSVGLRAACSDKDDNLWIVSYTGNAIYKLTNGVKVAEFSAGGPVGICCDKDNTIWIAENDSKVISKIVNGVKSTVGSTTENVHDIIADSNGLIWAISNTRLIKVSNGVITEVSLGGTTYAHSIVIDSKDQIYVSMRRDATGVFNNKIAMFDNTGTFIKFIDVGASASIEVCGLTIDKNDVLWATGYQTNLIYKIENGIVTKTITVGTYPWSIYTTKDNSLVIGIGGSGYEAYGKVVVVNNDVVVKDYSIATSICAHGDMDGVHLARIQKKNLSTLNTIDYYVSGSADTPTPVNPNGVTLTNISKTPLANTTDPYIMMTVLETSGTKKYVPGQVLQYECINDVQTFNTRNAKRIKVECWGAQGASIGKAIGGKGGYVYGEMLTELNRDYYLYVGSKGGYNDPMSGYNGGGQVTTASDTNIYTGGGATDIRTAIGDLYSRMIVGGGGGSADASNVSTTLSCNGGDAGGWTGLTGEIGQGGSQPGSGGSQTSGGTGNITGFTTTTGNKDGTFGNGSIVKTSSSLISSAFPAGGGGWYGGGTGSLGGGGGGSSYISGNPNCPTVHPEGIKFTKSGTQAGDNEGNGKIIITILETTDTFKYRVGDVINFKYTGAVQTFDTGNIKKVKVECYGAAGGDDPLSGDIIGGKGGYAVGELDLTTSKKLGIYVGGKGQNTLTSYISRLGGWNGGGNSGLPYSATYRAGAGGGGATDIRTNIIDNLKPTIYCTDKYSPCIIKESDTSYKMWFIGSDGTTSRILYSESTDGKVWSTPILVMDKGTCSYNNTQCFTPHVIKESDTSYKMWFGGFDGTNTRILYSESTDGKVWSTPVLVMDKGTCSYNTTQSSQPMVIKESDTSYKMWFTGDNGTNNRILYSESTDGKVWSTPILVMDKGGTSYNTSYSCYPRVIKESDTSYKMWFIGSNSTNYVLLYSTSTDGKVWSTPILVLDKGGTSYNTIRTDTPFIIKESDTSYKIWFSGFNNTRYNMLYSESNDGKVWNTPSLQLDYNTWLNQSLLSRLIVGGGGGGALIYAGGNGGGYSGVAGTTSGANGTGGIAGTQTTGYSLGIGGNGSNSSANSTINAEGNAGGGGGYYGGGGGIKLNTGTYSDATGGGGSSYISGDVNCPTVHPDGIILRNTGTTAGVNPGNGYACITVMKIDTDLDLSNYSIKTGTGPVSFSHNNSNDGVYDLVGNLADIVTGFKVGASNEINIVANNDIAIYENFKSPAWKAVDSSGNIIPAGSSTATKYSMATTGAVTTAFQSVTSNYTSYLLKALGLVPIETTDVYDAARMHFDFTAVATTADSIVTRGGHYKYYEDIAKAYNASIFTMNVYKSKVAGVDPLDLLLPYAGFRVCYYKP